MAAYGLGLLTLAFALPSAAQEAASATADDDLSSFVCADSAECVRRVEVGSVCRQSQCVRYIDKNDLLELIGLKKSPGVLEPWKQSGNLSALGPVPG